MLAGLKININKALDGLKEEITAKIRQENSVKAYKEGVLDVAENPVIFINPKELSGFPSIDGVIIYDQMEEQSPGVVVKLTERIQDRTDSETRMTELEATELVASLSFEEGPFAIANIGADNICIVNLPDENIDEKHEVIGLLSGMGADNFQDAPGNDADYNRAVGSHEGEHCNQKDGNSKLHGEVGADREMTSYLEGIGKGDVAEVIKHSRAIKNALAPFNDAAHATSGLLNNENEVTEDHYRAARSHRYDMKEKIAEHLGVKEDELDVGWSNNFDEYCDVAAEVTVEIRENGTDFENAQADYHEAYCDAIIERVIGGEAPTRESAPAELDIEEMKLGYDETTLQIEEEQYPAEEGYEVDADFPDISQMKAMAEQFSKANNNTPAEVNQEYSPAEQTYSLGQP